MFDLLQNHWFIQFGISFYSTVQSSRLFHRHLAPMCHKVMSSLSSLAIVACLLTLSQWSTTSVDAQVVPSESSKGVRFLRKRLAPSCDNFLETVLDGRWTPKRPPPNVPWKEKREITTILNRKEQELNEAMRFVWKKKGIPPNPWKSTTVCGYYRYITSNL